MTSEMPSPPPSLPKYLYEGMQKQDSDTLEDVKQYADELIEYNEAALEEDDLADGDERVRGSKQGPDGWTWVSKEIPCGKKDDGCQSCPHGPYIYRVKRKGEKLKWDYVGPQDSTSVPVDL